MSVVVFRQRETVIGIYSRAGQWGDLNLRGGEEVGVERIVVHAVRLDARKTPFAQCQVAQPNGGVATQESLHELIACGVGEGRLPVEEAGFMLAVLLQLLHIHLKGFLKIASDGKYGDFMQNGCHGFQLHLLRCITGHHIFRLVAYIADADSVVSVADNAKSSFCIGDGRVGIVDEDTGIRQWLLCLRINDDSLDGYSLGGSCQGQTDE